jgi:hypothetical protein
VPLELRENRSQIKGKRKSNKMELNIKSNVKWRAKAGSALVYFQKLLETQFAVFLLKMALGIKHTNKISKN